MRPTIPGPLNSAALPIRRLSSHSALIERRQQRDCTDLAGARAISSLLYTLYIKYSPAAILLSARAIYYYYTSTTTTTACEARVSGLILSVGI